MSPIDLRSVLTTLAAAAACAACSSLPADSSGTGLAGDKSILTGWRRCTDDNCGRNFFSAYSTFVFLRTDDQPQGGTPTVTIPPGRHWVEAHYSWGIGVVTGIGNWRNYGFELDVLPGHRYAIEEAPSGCIVPATQHWVNPKILRIVDRPPSGGQTVRDIKALEFCTPSSEDVGTCRQDSDCRSGTCTPFGGSTGYGMCGALRQ